MKYKRLIFILSVVVFILLIPLVAMQFTSEVRWTPSDFLIAAFLLFGTGLIFDFVIRKVKRIEIQIAICVVLLVTLIIIWAELAVGILGI